MKITQLDIEGFRSLKKASWKPGDLNVVIGPNGSGKSNLLRALELISAGAQERLGRFVQAEGGMGAILWDGRASEIHSEVILATRYNPPTAVYEMKR
jgi:predicted ATPase